MDRGRVRVLGSDATSVRHRLETLEKLLERSFVLPGTNRPVGLDAIVGLTKWLGTRFRLLSVFT